MSPATAAFGPLRFTGLTSLGLVLEALVGEKHLFAAGEHKLRTALRALQHLVVVFHEPLSPGPVSGRRLGGLCTREPKCLRKPVSGDAGRGSLGPAGTKPKRDPKNYPALRGPDSRKCGAEPRGKRIGGPNCFGAASLNLIRFPPLLLAQSLPRMCFLISLMMSSCCTLRLKRRRAFSRDSLSWMMTSATLLIHPQSGSDWFLAAPLAGHAAAGCRLLRAPPLR